MPKNALKILYTTDAKGITLMLVLLPDAVMGQLKVFEKHSKSLIQHGERSELRLYFEWTKVN